MSNGYVVSFDFTKYFFNSLKAAVECVEYLEDLKCREVIEFSPSYYEGEIANQHEGVGHYFCKVDSEIALTVLNNDPLTEGEFNALQPRREI